MKHPVLVIVGVVAVLVTAIMWFAVRDPNEVAQERAREAANEVVGDAVDSLGRHVNSLKQETDSLQLLLASVAADTVPMVFDLSGREAGSLPPEYWERRFQSLQRAAENNRRILTYIAIRQDRVLGHLLIVLCREPSARNLADCNREAR